jgi:adenylate kinase family enzyme
MTLDSRVVIVGNSGSGKSTLARELAQRMGAPAIDLDHIHWQDRGRGFELLRPLQILFSD